MHKGENPPVVLSSRRDFLRIAPLYTFNPWHAIYAHPAGEFPARLSFTRHLARQRNLQRFAALARTNRFDSIDVLVLKSVARGQLLYEVDSMDFLVPGGWYVLLSPATSSTLPGGKRAKSVNGSLPPRGECGWGLTSTGGRGAARCPSTVVLRGSSRKFIREHKQGLGPAGSR